MIKIRETSAVKVGSKNFSDTLFRKTLAVSAILVCTLLLAIFLSLTISSFPTIKELGLSFMYNKDWNPVKDHYGALPFLLGTLLTSFLSLIIAIPFTIAVGLFLGEYFKKGIISEIVKTVMELFASIPSVIYGFWGLFVFVPIMRSFETMIGVVPLGLGIMTSSLILSIMILPYGVSLVRQVILMVPSHLKEAAYSLGATRYEVIRYVILPYASSGIFAGILLSLGRALGETMVVTMLIGNSHLIPSNIFGAGNSMASVIANEFSEASGTLYTSALIEMGLFLFIVTMVINIIGQRVIKKFAV